MDLNNGPLPCQLKDSDADHWGFRRLRHCSRLWTCLLVLRCAAGLLYFSAVQHSLARMHSSLNGGIEHMFTGSGDRHRDPTSLRSMFLCSAGAAIYSRNHSAHLPDLWFRPTPRPPSGPFDPYEWTDYPTVPFSR